MEMHSTHAMYVGRLHLVIEDLFALEGELEASRARYENVKATRKVLVEKFKNQQSDFKDLMENSHTAMDQTRALHVKDITATRSPMAKGRAVIIDNMKTRSPLGSTSDVIAMTATTLLTSVDMHGHENISYLMNEVSGFCCGCIPAVS